MRYTVGGKFLPLWRDVDMIRLNGISKAFGDISAVDQVDLEVPQHGTLTIVGPSGSGKTTLLRLIAGLEIPDRGEVIINDRLVSKPAPYPSPC